MRKICSIIIEKVFLDEFIQKYEQLKSFDFEKQRIISHFFDFITSIVGVNIYTNISPHDLINDTLKYKKWLDIGVNTAFSIPDLFDNPNHFNLKNDLTGFVLVLCNHKAINPTGNLKSYLRLDSENIEVTWGKIKEFSSLVKSTANIKSDGWHFLGNYSTKSNSIVIVDRYLLKDRNTLNSNLKVILCSLLDANGGRPDIICYFDENVRDEDGNYQKLTSDELQNWIVSTLEEIDIIDFDLTFVRSNEIAHFGEEHNRFILNDYWRVKSGRSFDIVNKNNKNPSCDDVSVSFIFEPKIKEVLLADIKRLEYKLNNATIRTNCNSSKHKFL